MQPTKSIWTPPTPTPEAGQGPWCNEELTRWWVVCEHPDEAVAAVRSLDAEVFPIYFGWTITVERKCFRWVDPADWNEENEIVECMSSDEGAVEGWRVTVDDA
jgi:hypothetical protein